MSDNLYNASADYGQSWSACHTQVRSPKSAIHSCLRSLISLRIVTRCHDLETAQATIRLLSRQIEEAVTDRDSERAQLEDLTAKLEECQRQGSFRRFARGVLRTGRSRLAVAARVVSRLPSSVPILDA
jgi:uncharacterized coiled-coil protein SlyX